MNLHSTFFPLGKEYDFFHDDCFAHYSSTSNIKFDELQIGEGAKNSVVTLSTNINDLSCEDTGTIKKHIALCFKVYGY